MFRLKITFFTLVVTFAHWTTFQDSADAGLLRDWLNRRRARRAQQAGLLAQSRVPVSAVNPLGLQPGQCATTCQQTCSRVVVNYVPCTSYRTTYQRVPVTQYRPQTTTDPCTGCSVTCMRPCTTYSYRMSRVPYTTYRPVYRTENYRVPVTTISNNCNTCATGVCGTSTCDTCTTGLVGQQAIPSGTITTDGTFGSLPAGSTVTPLPTPADNTPSLNPQNSNRSVIESSNGSSTRFEMPERSNWELTSNTKSSNSRDWSEIPVAVTASASPVTQKWTYTVKQASYVAIDTREPAIVQTIRGEFKSPEELTLDAESADQANSHWETVDW